MNSQKLTPLFLRRCVPLFRRSMATEKKISADYEHPTHSLHSDYQNQKQSMRAGRAADPLTGRKPNASQKYFLVLTRLFRNTSDIPEYVPNQTMQRMHDRMRVIVIITAVLLFYSISLTSEWRTRRQMDIDKASGKVVRTIHDI